VRVLRVEASVTRLSSVEPLAGGTQGRPLESSQDREGGGAWQDHSSHDHAAVAARTGEGVYREDTTPLRSVSPMARAGGLPSGACVDRDPGGAVWVSAVRHDRTAWVGSERWLIASLTTGVYGYLVVRVGTQGDPEASPA
jgi:hypothetical protein